MIALSFADKLVFQLSQELKRLQRRKALMSGDASSSQSSSGSGSIPGTPGGSKEQPLFTLKQVSRDLFMRVGNPGISLTDTDPPLPLDF